MALRCLGGALLLLCRLLSQQCCPLPARPDVLLPPLPVHGVATHGRLGILDLRWKAGLAVQVFGAFEAYSHIHHSANRLISKLEAPHRNVLHRGKFSECNARGDEFVEVVYSSALWHCNCAQIHSTPPFLAHTYNVALT